MIIVADDDRRVIGSLRMPLAAAGWRVESAANGVEAYRLLRSTSCRFLGLDVHMPELAGMELLEVMAREGLHLPTVVMSGDTEMNQDMLNRFPFVVGFLPKPVEIHHLLDLLKLHAESVANVRIVTSDGGRWAGRLLLPESVSMERYLASSSAFLTLTDATVATAGDETTLTVPRVYVNTSQVVSLVPVRGVDDTAEGGSDRGRD